MSGRSILIIEDDRGAADALRPMLSARGRLLRKRDACSGIPVAMMTGDYLLDESVINELEPFEVPLYFKPLWEEDLVESWSAF